MKSVKGLSILVLALLLQGCLPDSFTKFEEEPAVKAEGGTSGDEVNICEIDPGDAFCATPARIEYSPVSYTYNIDNATLDSNIFIEPRIFSDGEYEGLNEYMTFTIQPPLPASTGLRFDTNSGNITGKPLGFYHKTQHTVSAIFTGNEPLTEGEIIAGTIELSIATPLSFLMNIQNPVDQKVVLDVNDITPFLGITESDNRYIAAEKENGSAKITYVDEATNQVIVDPNTVGSNNYYVLRTENSLALDITNDNSSSFANERANSTIGTIALSRTDTPSVLHANALSAFDVAGKQVSALKFNPTGAEASLTDNEKYSIKYDISPDVSPYGLSFTQSSKCYSKQTFPAPVNGTEVDTSAWSPLTLEFDSNTDLSSFGVGDQVISSRGVIATINSVSNGANKQLLVATATDERIFGSGFISPYDPPLATSFSKEDALIVRSVLDECSKDPANPSFVFIPGGTIWGQIDDTKSLLPSTFTITATNNHSSQSIREFNLSILSPRVPKGISDLAYRQQEGIKLKVTVDNTTDFKVGDKVSSKEGKTAEVIGLNSDTNQLFLKIDNFGTPTVSVDGETVNKDDLFFANAGLIDNSENFFVAEATISAAPVFLYTDEIINDGTGQPFIKNIISPQLFEDNANIAETRSLTFEITPDVTLLGSDINFQAQSACFDTASGSSDTTLWTAEPDFTNCDPMAPTAGFTEIRGGTIWGAFDPDVLPLDETEFTVTAKTLTGTEATATFQLEATPAVEPPELSYTQDFLLKVLDVTNFTEGDYFSNSAGSYGIVKQVIDVDSDNRYLWVKLINGTAGLDDDQGIDNKKVYRNQRGYVTQVHPVNAIFTTSANISGIPNIIADEDEKENIITNGAGAQARVVYQNANELFVRVTEGVFTTGETLSDEDGNTLSAQVTNINAQNLTLNIQNVTGSLPSDSQITDSEIVYHDDALGTDYTGVASIRSKSGTSMDVEMIKDRLGDLDYEPGYLIYFDNPHDGTSTSAEVASISTNAQRYTFHKDLPLYIFPNVEPSSSVASYEVTPDLPEGVNMDVNTGVISGIPSDRSDFIEYTVTASGFQDKEYKFKLEVKDYYGLVDQTAGASTYILHKAGMGNGRTPCSITRDQWSQSDTKNRDIGCYLEAGEKELYTSGIDIDLVFGKDMCQFVKHGPYHMAIYEAGRTGSSPATTPPPTPEVHIGDVNECEGSGADPDLTVDQLQDECFFDHRTPGSSLYNCDSGSFTYNEVEYSANPTCECSGCAEQGNTYDSNTCGTCTDGTSTTKTSCLTNSEDWIAGSEDFTNPSCTTSSTPLTHECDGTPSACMEGAGTDILTRAQLFTLASDEDNVQDLERISYTYSSPEERGFESNRYLANFLQVSSEPSCTNGDYELNYDALENLMVDRTQSANLSSEIPNALTGRPFYTYECLDGAGETIARIRLMVRDWDRTFRASSQIDKVNPDPGVLMDRGAPLTDSYGNPYNEFVDHEPDSLAGSCGVGGTLNILDDLDVPAWPQSIDASTLPCGQGECFF